MPFKILWPLLACCVSAVASSALSEDRAVELAGVERGKSYRLTVGLDGSLTLSPLERLAVQGTNPAPQPRPEQPPPTDLRPAVKQITQEALAAGGSKETATALSGVYSLVADGIKDAKIPPAEALRRLKELTNAVMTLVDDDAMWEPWRAAISEALNTSISRGDLATPAQWELILRDIAAGVQDATGIKLSPREIVESNRAALVANGILDGLDIDKLIKLIELIMLLIKTFGGGG